LYEKSVWLPTIFMYLYIFFQLISKVIKNDETLDLIGETVYKWNYDVKDGKFQKLSNICGCALARLWPPYILTRTKSISIRL